MSIVVAYRADSVGPVVKRVVKEGEGLVASHEDEIDFSKLVSTKPVAAPPQPAPPDPLIRVWQDASAAAEDFTNLNPNRSQVALSGIDFLLSKLKAVKDAVAIPAPVAPPAPTPPKWIPNVLVRWGSRREGRADIEINSAASVALARDKKESRRRLGTLAPTTWFRSLDVKTPCVIRPRRHHAGKKFYVCHTNGEVERAIAKCGPGWYATELIDKAHEYRVFILQDRVIRVSEKTPPDDGGIAWNVGAGASATGIAKKNWNLAVINTALLAARALSLDWTAVDVVVDKAGRVLVLEANTAPGLSSNTRALEQIAWAFSWIDKNDPPKRLDLNSASKWQDYLHPSLLDSTTE